MAYITMPETRIPVIMETDVVVVGGGPAGIGAAIRSAQSGADTLIIERFGSPGGMFTNGLMCITVGEPPDGLPKEILDRLRRGGYVNDPLEKYPGLSSNPLYHYHGPSIAPGWRGPSKLSTFDPDMAACVMMEIMEECDVKLQLRSLFIDTKVEDGTIMAVVIEGASAKQAIAGKVFVDATGRGDVVARSGAPYTSAGNEFGLPIPPGLMWKMSDVDYQRLFEYQKEDPKLDKLMENAKAKGELPPYRLKKTPYYGGLYTGHPHLEMCPTLYPGDMLLWAPAVHEWGLNCAENAEDLTRAEIAIRKEIMAELNFLKKYVPGFEKAHLSGIAPFMGIREGRHPIGEHVMTYEDISNQRTFEDAALRQTAWNRVDIEGGIRTVTFDIPYRSFLAKKINNLLLAGDTISMEHKALLHIRGFGTAMRLGEVAGIAAARSVKSKVTPKNLKWDAPL